MEENAKKTILIIEDNRLNLEMASELLTLSGFQVVQAEDARTGIELLDVVNPDLILMDLHLPYLDGFEATKIIKSNPKYQDIPIVAFTALAMKEDQEKAIACGCSGVVSKPIDVTTFSDTIRSYLEPESQAEQSEKKEFKKNLASSKALQVSQPVVDGPIRSTEMASHTVLVVDDNPMNVDLLKDALESMGQKVLVAYRGQESLDIAAQEYPDLILLDIMMPEMDGFTVLGELKRNPELSHIPVIIISALSKTEDLVRGFREGTFDYITKPFKVEEVKARVMATLRLKELQDQLRAERDKLGAVFQCSNDGIVLMDSDLNIISANPLVQIWFPGIFSREVSKETPVNFVQLVNDQCQLETETACPIRSEDIALVSSEVDEHKKLLSEIRIPDDSGGIRYLHLNAGYVTDWGQNRPGYVVILRDISPEKNLQKSKETFVATLTHDLKTPIRAEHRALEILQSETLGPLNDTQKELVSEIIQSNQYMARLVESLLTTYMYEEGKVKLNMERLDIHWLIRQKIAVPLHTLAVQKQQTFLLNVPDEPAYIQGDAIEVQRVLNNLVQNAINFTPKGGKIILATEVNHGEITVNIQDTGPGIDPETQKVLFERYQSMAKKYQQVGTGLGLYLSKKIIEAHGGTIGVESKVGEGSRFYFTLPLAMEEADKQPQDEPLAQSR